jgi:signal transduction histidine kinase
LKTFSHLDTNDIKKTDINQGIESTLILLRSSLPPNIKIVKNLGDIPIIECYPGKLNQVFMNILINAIQAMEKYTVRQEHSLTILTYLEDERVCVCIEDTGMGMSKEVKEKIFEPFFTTKDVGEGTGLGMSIVYKIIASHNAKLDIESEVGVGTKMTIKLPLNLQIVSV